MVAVLGLIAGGALAQAVGAPAFDLERLMLNPGGRDGLVVGGGDVLDPSTIRFSLVGHYEHAPLVLLDGNQRVATLVGSRVTAHLTVGFGVTRWLEIGAQVPVVLWQGNSANLAALGVAAPAATALGSPWVQARLSAVRERDGMPFDLSIDVLASLPIGGPGAFTGDAAPSVLPRLGVGRTIGDVVRLGFEVGGWFRTTGSLSSSALSSAAPTVQLGLGASTLGPTTRFELSVRGAVPVDAQPLSLEVLGGVRQPVGPLEIFLVGGPGFGSLPGTPLFRILAGVAFPSGARGSCQAQGPHRPAECPELDDDGDGVPNGEDVCALSPGVRGAGGCPDADGDGVRDEDDRCPALAGPASRGGCPDADGDGVSDGEDHCPSASGPVENHGCPWPDADHDGVADRDDACPQQAGPAPRGCPLDTDGDGVPDEKDRCPGEAGALDAGGCPAAPQVKLESDRLIINEKIFFDPGKASIQPRSFELLNAVAKVLCGHPEVKHVFIDGHTDATGKRELNVKLSRARAESVKASLVKAGVGSAVLEPRGFGPDRPIADNQSEAGREQNRRVEFLIETRGTVRENP